MFFAKDTFAIRSNVSAFIVFQGQQGTNMRQFLTTVLKDKDVVNKAYKYVCGENKHAKLVIYGNRVYNDKFLPFGSPETDDE